MLVGRSPCSMFRVRRRLGLKGGGVWTALKSHPPTLRQSLRGTSGGPFLFFGLGYKALSPRVKARAARGPRYK